MRIPKAVAIAFLTLVVAVAFAAAVITWRGFSASSAPSAFEATVARSLRNFAIPGRESRKINPLAGDSVAIQQGREAFLARCATCHGVDGRGTTPIGANQYPRVPDLHSDLTQSLTDGEIHYVIENTSQKAQKVGLRVYMDTFIVDNDGCLFAAPTEPNKILDGVELKDKVAAKVDKAVSHH